MKIEDLDDIVKKLFLSGALRKVTRLAFCDSKRPPKWARKMADASSCYSYRHGVLRDGKGNKFDGLAYWVDGYDLVSKGRITRIRILVIHINKTVPVYGIPNEMISTLKTLPDNNLSEKDVKLLLAVADDISRESAFTTISVDDEIASTMEENQEYWLKQSFDSARLYEALSETSLNPALLADAIDAQYHAMRSLTNIPHGGNNYIVPNNNPEGRKYVEEILTACTFSTYPGLYHTGPLTLRNEDQNGFDSFAGRSMLINNATEKSGVIKRFSSEAEGAEQMAMAGNYYPCQMSSHLHSISTSPLDLDYVMNISVPPNLCALTPEVLDMFRTAAAHVLQPEHLDWCLNEFIVRTGAADSYRLNRMQLWRQIIKERICFVLFSNTDFYEPALSLINGGKGKAESSLEQSVDEIIGRYKKMDDVDSRFCEKSAVDPGKEKICFRHKITKGAKAGTRILAFSDNEVLLDGLEEIGLTGVFLEAFLQQMKQKELLVLDKDSATKYKINLGGRSRSFIALIDPRDC